MVKLVGIISRIFGNASMPQFIYFNEAPYTKQPHIVERVEKAMHQISVVMVKRNEKVKRTQSERFVGIDLSKCWQIVQKPVGKSTHLNEHEPYTIQTNITQSNLKNPHFVHPL